MGRTVGKMIALLARKNQSYLSGVLSKYNLTAAEQPFFMELQHRADVTQEELTALVCVDKAATARAVKSLEEKGFLTREQDAADRRQNRVRATDKALRLGAVVREELERFNRQLTRGIPPEELAIIRSGLERMERNLAQLAEQRGKAPEGGASNGTA